jgi:hypothetical protein
MESQTCFHTLAAADDNHTIAHLRFTLRDLPVTIS